MPDITVVDYQRRFKIPSSIMIAAVTRAAKFLRLPHEAITLVFAGERRMRAINKKYLSHDFVTDVITFESGDIVICPAVAARFARRHGQTFEQEILLYAVHGLLHLAGYQDKEEADIAQMRTKEQTLLAKIKL